MLRTLTRVRGPQPLLRLCSGMTNSKGEKWQNYSVCLNTAINMINILRKQRKVYKETSKFKKFKAEAVFFLLFMLSIPPIGFLIVRFLL